MNRRSLLPWLLGSLLLASTSSAAETGFSVRAGVGTSTCLASSGASCEGLGTHVGTQAALGYRVVDWLGLYADVNVGWLDAADTAAPAARVSLRTLSVLPMLRGFAPVGPLELTAGLGAGYARTSLHVVARETGETGGLTWHSWFSPRVELGLAVPLGDTFSVGATGAMQLHLDGSGTYCFDDGDCRGNSGAVVDLVQVNAVVMATF